MYRYCWLLKLDLDFWRLNFVVLIRRRINLHDGNSYNLYLQLFFPGGFPYPTVNNHEILEYLSQGKRLDRPEICSEILYQLMLKCWHENPESRPTFAEIVKQLQPQNQKIYVDFNSLGPDYVFPPTREQVLESRINEQDNIKHWYHRNTFTESYVGISPAIVEDNIWYLETCKRTQSFPQIYSKFEEMRERVSFAHTGYHFLK